MDPDPSDSEKDRSYGKCTPKSETKEDQKDIGTMT